MSSNNDFQCFLGTCLKDKDKTLSIGYSFSVGDLEVGALIENQEATFALEVFCRDTLYKEVYKLGREGNLQIPTNNFCGVVKLKPIIALVVSDCQADLRLGSKASPDGSQPFDVGAILREAKTEEKYIDTEGLFLEKIASISLSDSVDEDKYQFELGDNCIRILAGSKIKALLDNYVVKPHKRPHLAMGIFKDCIVFALQKLPAMPRKKQKANLWADLLNRELTRRGIRLKSGLEFNELNLLAQTIVADAGINKLYERFQPARGIPILTANSVARLRRAIQEDWRVYEKPFDKLVSLYSLETTAHSLPTGDIDFALSLSQGRHQDESHDVDNCLKLYRKFSALTPAQATDERLWVTLCFNQFRDYCRSRWPLADTQDDDKATQHILSHWFAEKPRHRLRDNAVSRLWWLAHIAGKVSEWSIEQTLEYIQFNSDFRSSLLERPGVSAPSRVLSSILMLSQEAKRKGVEYKRESFRKFMIETGELGKSTALASLSVEELVKLLRPIFEDAYGYKH